MFGSTSKPILLAQKALMCMLQSKYLFSFWAAILKPASQRRGLGKKWREGRSPQSRLFFIVASPSFRSSLHILCQDAMFS